MPCGRMYHWVWQSPQGMLSYHILDTSSHSSASPAWPASFSPPPPSSTDPQVSQCRHSCQNGGSEIYVDQKFFFQQETKTYSIHKDILVAWFAVELPTMFIKSSRVQTLATLLALDALFVEWCSVNCHERLKKKYIIFFVILMILPCLCRIHRYWACGALGSCGRCCPAHGVVCWWWC